jgi:nucleotidyltransferase substrate binding protein (TIGR01987 family)
MNKDSKENNNKRYSHSLLQFNKALDRLQEALLKKTEDKLIIDGTIQRFEFSVELAWKSLKKILEDEELITTVSSPKAIIRMAYQLGWIKEESLWINMLIDRNQTSHTYKEDLAQAIYLKLGSYYEQLRQLQIFLQKNYG